MAAIACTPASPTHATTVCKLAVTATPGNTTTGYSTTIYPTSPQLTYYIKFVVGGVEKGRSYVFSTSPGSQTHDFVNYIFPTAGSWTVTVNNAVSNAVVATTSVTVA